MARRARRYRGRSGTGRSANTGRLLLMGIALCVALYFLSAGAAGDWLAEHIITPIINGIGGGDNPESTVQFTAAPTAAAGKSDQQIEHDAFTLYTIQLGAFGEQQNAREQAITSQQQGAAGYIYQDDMYRVLAAGYLSEKDAQTVCERLTGEEVPCHVFTLAAPAVSVDVRADGQQAAAAQHLIDAWTDGIAEIEQYSMDYDRKVLDRGACLSQVKDLLGRLAKARKAVEDLDPLKPLIGSYDALPGLCAELISEDLPAARFPVLLKHLQLKMAEDYIDFAQTLL